MSRWIVLLALPATAIATPVLTHQGRLLDSGGVAINTPTTLGVSLYDTESSEEAFWTKQFTDTPVEDGYYALALVTDSLGAPLDPLDFADGEVWIEVSSATGVLGGKQRLSSTPFALMSAGVVLPVATDPLCDTPGALAFDGNQTILVCDGTDYVSISSSGTSGPDHVALNDQTFGSSGDVTAQGWSCTSPSGAYNVYNSVGYMHLHNAAFYECHRNVSGLIPGREYRLSYRRSYDEQRLIVRELDDTDSVIGSVHESTYDSSAASTHRGWNVLTEAFFTAPASGRVQIWFDNAPNYTNGGQTHIDLRTHTPPTAPHLLFNNWTPASHDDVFAAGWDTGVSSPGANNKLWHHNSNPEYRLTHFFQVVPGETYAVSYTKYSGNGRVSVFAADTYDNRTSSLIGRSDDPLGDGLARSFTFVAPGNGWVKMVVDSATLENYAISGLTIQTQ